MAATLSIIQYWFRRAEEIKASHMIVKMDIMDYEDYPIYVMPGQDPKAVALANGDRTMECYLISLGWEIQSKEHRANHWEMEDVNG